MTTSSNTLTLKCITKKIEDPIIVIHLVIIELEPKLDFSEFLTSKIKNNDFDTKVP